MFVDDVWGVTELHDVVYVVSWQSSTILRFCATLCLQLTYIEVMNLKLPCDITACERTSQVYVADHDCVWRMSADGADVKRWLPKSTYDTLTPSALSVTNTRLLVMSRRTRQLIQYDADGDELRRVQLPNDVDLEHAVESLTGTFIVTLHNTQLKWHGVHEVNTAGEVLRMFTSLCLTSLGWIARVAVDSHGNMFVADCQNSLIQLLKLLKSLIKILPRCVMLTSGHHAWRVLFQHQCHLFRHKAAEYWSNTIRNCHHDTRLLRSKIRLLLEPCEPCQQHQSACDLASNFTSKVDRVRQSLSDAMPPVINSHQCDIFSTLYPVSVEVVMLLSRSSTKHRPLDPVPTCLWKRAAEQFAPILAGLCNATFQAGGLPSSQKHVLVSARLKKLTFTQPTSTLTVRFCSCHVEAG